MRPFSIVLALFASVQFTTAIPATDELELTSPTSSPVIVERESTTIPSRLLTGFWNGATIEPSNLLFNTPPDRRSIANETVVNQTHASTTTTSTSTTTLTTTPEMTSTTTSNGLLSLQLLKTIDSSSGKFIF